jgi:hypothetical protein
MTPREKYLALGFGAVILAGGGHFGFQSIRKGFDTKSNQVEALEDQVRAHRLTIAQGTNDRERIQKVTARSLPNSAEKSQADYTQWLTSLAESSNLKSPKTSFNPPGIPEAGVYRRYGFTVGGSGTIENLNQLLFKFYEKDYLHRLTSLKISPIPNTTYQLSILMNGEVLSLNAASDKQPIPDWISPRVSKSMAEYRQALTMRNLFSPANHLPMWPETATTQALRGTPFTYNPSAKDEDKDQSIRYEIMNELPKGMQISKEGDKITWTPDAIGKVELKLLAYDNGIPQGWSTQTLTIDVVEPPPPVDPPKPPPKFDVASQAEVTGLTAGRDGKKVHIKSKLEGKVLELKIGDKLTLGSIEGTVVEIGANYADIETEGKRWTVGMDESLLDAYRRTNKID